MKTLLEQFHEDFHRDEVGGLSEREYFLMKQAYYSGILAGILKHLNSDCNTLKKEVEDFLTSARAQELPVDGDEWKRG